MKLTLELMSVGTSGHSLYRYLTTKAWTTLRQTVLEKNGSCCAVCEVTNVQLDCNEQWEYNDETHIVRLVGLEMLCQMCHLVKHMNQRGASLDVLAEHFMKVNECSRQAFDEYYQKCLEEQTRREFDPYTRGPLWWEQDWGEYASLLAQEGNLKRRYQWEDGLIVTVGTGNKKGKSE